MEFRDTGFSAVAPGDNGENSSGLSLPPCGTGLGGGTLTVAAAVRSSACILCNWERGMLAAGTSGSHLRMGLNLSSLHRRLQGLLRSGLGRLGVEVSCWGWTTAVGLDVA